MSDVQKTPTDHIKLPAIGILVVGILGIISAIYSTLNVVFGLGATFFDPNDVPPEMQQAVAWLSSVETVGIFVNVLGSGFLIWAASQMLKLRSHTPALIASVIAMIPCWGGCCCIGLPVGIWALLVLLKPEVKAAFDREAQGG